MSTATSPNLPAFAYRPPLSDIWPPPSTPKPSAPSPRPAGHPSPAKGGDKGEAGQSATLLEGFRLLLQYLVNEEANYLCGAYYCQRTRARINYRLGRRPTIFRIPIGSFLVHVPVLKFFHPRVPIVKRARRLSPGILVILARIHAYGVTQSDVAQLVKTAWTLKLPDELLTKIVFELTPAFEQWRGAPPQPCQAVQPYQPVPFTPFPHPAPSRPAPTPASLLPTPPILLDGFSRLLHFILEEEADFLCGAGLFIRSPERINHRLGYYKRTFSTPAGAFPLRVPHMRHFHPRIPIVKRAKRLAPQILDTLARIYADAPPAIPKSSASAGLQPADGAAAPAGNEKPNTANTANTAALNAEAAALIKLLWTVDLPGDLLAQLATQLSLILDQWRAGIPAFVPLPMSRRVRAGPTPPNS